MTEKCGIVHVLEIKGVPGILHERRRKRRSTPRGLGLARGLIVRGAGRSRLGTAGPYKKKKGPVDSCGGKKCLEKGKGREPGKKCPNSRGANQRGGPSSSNEKKRGTSIKKGGESRIRSG